MKKARIYILPTRFGMIFVAGSGLMILIGAAYQNNLVNLLAFFMLALVFVCMIQTHNNLRDVRIAGLETEGGFAGTQFLVTSVLENLARDPRYSIEIGLRGTKPTAVYDNFHPLLGRATLKLRAAYPAKKRGRHRFKEARISSVYPLGLFWAWMWLPVEAEVLVYPEPKGTRATPAGGGPDRVGAEHQIALGGDDFHGHRKYQTGDNHRHIDWKAHARGRPLMVKEFSGGVPQSALLDWFALEGLETEERLSQLAAWVEDARLRRIDFGLRMPGTMIAPGSGHQHSIRCLEALAVYGEDSSGGKSA